MGHTPIRITFVLNDFLVGGMQRQLAAQLRHYDRQLYTFSIVTLFSFPGMPNLYDELPSDVAVRRLSFKGIFDISGWRELRKTLREFAPDLVVSSLFFSNFAVRLLQPGSGYVSIAREHNTHTNRPYWQRLANRLLQKRSATTVAVSEAVASFTSRAEGIPRERFTVIGNGIDTERVRGILATLPGKSQLQEDMGITGRTVLVNTARLTRQKNHRLLLAGFARGYARNPSLFLLIVGEGPLDAALRAYAHELGLDDAVRFVGYQPSPYAFYKAADTFIATSDMEGFSNSLLEALACGLPALVTRTGGIEEALQDGVNGFIIAESTPEAVDAAIAQFETSDAESLAQEARASAERNNLHATVSAYETLFTRTVHPIT